MEQAKLKEINKYIRQSLFSIFSSSDIRCLVCDTEISDIEEYLCEDCKQKLSLENHNRCKVCNRLSNKDICKYCAANKKPFKTIYAVFEYTDPVDRFINEFKEQGNTIYGRMFVKSLLEQYENFDIKDIDLITSVPANKLRKISRLRDAPKFFAKALSKHIKIEYSNNCLKRKGLAKAMRKRSSIQRMELAKKSYAISDYDVKGRNILLIDDVFTSGATTHVCTNLLLENGAKSVTILAMVCVSSK